MYSSGIDKVWKEDEKFQTLAIKGILENIRGVTGDLQEKVFEYMKKDGMFYVPTDTYMPKFFGEGIREYSHGIYLQGEMCKLSFRLAMPIRLLDNRIIGFIGYNNKDDSDPDNPAFVKYLYPPKRLLTKGRYIYTNRDEFKKAIADGYVCIVDGLFDKCLLEVCGINAISLCGSDLTEYHKMYLKEIPHKVIIADNDSAGRKLASSIKYCWPTAIEILQSDTGDIDSFIRSNERMQELQEIIEQMKLEGFLCNHQLRRKIHGERQK